MKTLHETKTLRYEIFDLSSLNQMADVVAKAFSPFRSYGDRTKIIHK